jgi:hypothetical protein
MGVFPVSVSFGCGILMLQFLWLYTGVVGLFCMPSCVFWRPDGRRHFLHRLFGGCSSAATCRAGEAAVSTTEQEEAACVDSVAFVVQ